jgi:hypothetical protein
MKKIILAIMLLITISVTKAQAILGTYEQSALVAPDEYRDSENDVTITKDAKSTKKIWIANLIPNQKFYAVLNTKANGSLIYSVPKQRVGNYQINIGCIVYTDESEDDDEKDGEVLIALNNKSNCYGISQMDYDAPISIGKGGVNAGGVKIGSNGSVNTGGVGINGSDVKVNTKAIMAGIQYIGNKQGMTKKKKAKDEDD